MDGTLVVVGFFFSFFRGNTPPTEKLYLLIFNAINMRLNEFDVKTLLTVLLKAYFRLHLFQRHFITNQNHSYIPNAKTEYEEDAIFIWEINDDKCYFTLMDNLIH